MRIRKRYSIPIAVVLLLGSAYYYLCVARAEIQKEANGWRVRFSYVRMGCRRCQGRIEELECNGRAVSVPPLKETSEGIAHFVLYSPVGAFDCVSGYDQWRFIHWDTSMIKRPPSISEEALKRGYHVVNNEPEHTGGNESDNGHGLPAHWCLGRGDEHERWLDPAMIDRLPW